MSTSNETPQARPKLPGARHGAWLIAPLGIGPLLALMSFAETTGSANAVRSLADSMILLFPILALGAAVLPRFTAKAAAGMTAVFVIADMTGFRAILHTATRGLLHDNDNPSWVSVVMVLIGCAALGAATMKRATLARVVLLIMSMAQIVVLTTFHQLLVIHPIEVEGSAETSLMRDYASRHGSIEGLCGVDGRVCYAGSVGEMARLARETIPHSLSIEKILADTQSRPALLHSWTEMILPSTDEEGLRNVTVFKRSSNEALISVSQVGPTRVFDVAKTNFGVLASLFHQAWITIALLIVWRHGDYRLTRKGWRREAR